MGAFRRLPCPPTDAGPPGSVDRNPEGFRGRRTTEGQLRSHRRVVGWLGDELGPVVAVASERGRITKEGSKLVRRAVIEAVSRYHGGPKLAGDFRRIAQRRGTIYYGLRDSKIRCLVRAEAA